MRRPTKLTDFEYSIVSDRLYLHGKRTIGYPNNKGAMMIGLEGNYVLVHRLIWRLVTGEWPPDQIDHENRINNDNRWLNLRLATNSLNKQNTLVYKNNKLKIKGIRKLVCETGYLARITLNGVCHSKYFSKLEDAVAWRKAMEQKLHPYRPERNDDNK